MMHAEEPEPIESRCILDSNRGIYIPQTFAAQCCPADWGISAEDIAVLLAGPDHDDYWEVWSDVLDYASWTDPHGRRWILSQDDDLFMELWDDPNGVTV
jgi:hypothetical protein